MQTSNAATLGYIVFLPYVFWRIYTRHKRSVGRQHLPIYRAPLNLLLYSVIIFLLLDADVLQREQVLWMSVAWLAGIALALYGLHLTRFEIVDGRYFYTPNSALGLAITLLFIARILYRLVEIYFLQTATTSVDEFVYSNLTLGVFGVLAGYYMGYALGLIKWRLSLSSSTNKH